MRVVKQPRAGLTPQSSTSPSPGPRFYLGSRSKSKGEEAVENLQREDPGIREGSVVVLELDLSSIKGIIAAVDEFKKKETRLDILGSVFPTNEDCLLVHADEHPSQ